MHQSADDTSPPVANGNAGFHADDLLHNYMNAVECLTNCEALVVTLQQELASKDEHISSLEEKLIQQSLELASSKTKEGALEHRLSLSKRVSDDDDSGDGDEEGRAASTFALQAANRLGGRSSISMGKAYSGSGTTVKKDRRRHSCAQLQNLDSQTAIPRTLSSWSRFSNNSEHIGPTLDESKSNATWGAASSESLGTVQGNHSTLDESSSSRMSGLGQFFLRRRTSCEGSVQEEVSPEEKREQDHNNILRLPPNSKRMQLQHQASLVGVVFPRNFEDVVNKGLDPRSCLQPIHQGITLKRIDSRLVLQQMIDNRPSVAGNR
mmetsp:Transcript_6857/g.15675  ORF Transcript_6857/g.15675 Transcript_6857/m.15675 type:complete len:322 (+) Transcript_6857:767-1732(+)